MSSTIIKNPKISIDPDLLKKLATDTDEMGQVIVHCLCKAPASYSSYIRIWPSTFLFDLHSAHKSKLLFAEKINMFPEWLEVPAGSSYVFTLIFGGLPSSCKYFDLQEVIPQSGGFAVHKISRNDTDVYFVQV